LGDKVFKKQRDHRRKFKKGAWVVGVSRGGGGKHEKPSEMKEDSKKSKKGTPNLTEKRKECLKFGTDVIETESLLWAFPSTGAKQARVDEPYTVKGKTWSGKTTKPWVGKTKRGKVGEDNQEGGNKCNT